MASHLLIVESPSKAKTLKKYLGKDFEILASYGHVRDLVPKTGAVDPDDNFRMKYELIDRNVKHVDAITKAVQHADTVLLATDPDREGEAIAWHLSEILKSRKALKDKKLRRVVFYDQLGAGNSAVAEPHDPAIWTPELYVEEVDAVRGALGLGTWQQVVLIDFDDRARDRVVSVQILS